MQLKKKYNLNYKAKKLQVPELESVLNDILERFGDKPVFLIDCWSAPLIKKITIVTNELELAFKLNNYDNIKVVVASDNMLTKLLKHEWVREYFAKQMPECMLEEILSLVELGHSQEEAWSEYIKCWLPENDTAKTLVEILEEN